MIVVHVCLAVSHVDLHQLKHLTCFLFDGAVACNQHWLFDGVPTPGKHVGNGDPAAEDALSVHIEVFGSPVYHAALRDGLW